MVTAAPTPTTIPGAAGRIATPPTNHARTAQPDAGAHLLRADLHIGAVRSNLREMFIERCRALIAAPPGADWTPVAIQMEK